LICLGDNRDDLLNASPLSKEAQTRPKLAHTDRTDLIYFDFCRPAKVVIVP